MKTRSVLAASLLAALSSPVMAQVWLPAEGIWQIDGANGSGLTLDVRDTAIGIGLYTYDEEGVATWYSGAGSLSNTGVLEAELTRFEDGDGDTPTAVGTLDVSLSFSGSAQGSLVIGDGEALLVRHFAFGADYIGGINLGQSLDVTAVPDMRGRWVIAPTGPDAGQTIDIEFKSVITNEGAIQFGTSADPSGAGAEPGYIFVCGQQPNLEMPTSRCHLSRLGEPPEPPLTPNIGGYFIPEDLSATRIASAASDLIAFRVPNGINTAQSGIWQIAGRFGEGVTLDVRDNVVAIGVYGYDDDGKPTWSLATGPLEQDTDGQRMSADLLTFAGGSCLDCEHADPTVSDTRPISVEFLGATRARVTIGDDAPLSMSLLPFGAEYLGAPFGGDPDAEEFGAHALPAMTGGGWVQSSIRESAEQGEAPRYPAVAYDIEWVDATLRDDTYRALYAMPGDPWGVDDNDPRPASLSCKDDGADNGNAICNLTHAGIPGTPDAVLRDIADIAPWNITANRISGHSANNGLSPESVYLFRIPPRPASPD